MKVQFPVAPTRCFCIHKQKQTFFIYIFKNKRKHNELTLVLYYFNRFFFLVCENCIKFEVRMDGAKCSFLDLSNDVICVLLRYLDATSLYQLSRTCSRLDELIRSDFTLWRCIDARRQPHSIEKFAYCLDRCYDDGNTWTHTFLISSNDNTRSIIPAYFFTTVSSFKHLTVLAFENQLFDGSEVCFLVK